MPNSLESRVVRAAANLAGAPVGEAREEFRRLFHGETIGGGHRVADVFHDPTSGRTVFVAGDVAVEVTA